MMKPIPLQNRLLNKLKPWLSHLGWGKPRKHRPSFKSVKSSPLNLMATTNSSQTRLSDTPSRLTVSMPSLLNRLDMGSGSIPYSESERMDLVEEVDDMKNLSGIMPVQLTKMTSTISMQDCPRETSLNWETTVPAEGQAAASLWTMIPMIEDNQTRNKGSMNHKCRGTLTRNELGAQTQTLVATRRETPSISSRETLQLSSDRLCVHQVLQQDSPVVNGMHLSRESQSTSISSSVLSTTSAALTKASDVLGLLRSSLESQSLQLKLK